MGGVVDRVEDGVGAEAESSAGDGVDIEEGGDERGNRGESTVGVVAEGVGVVEEDDLG